MEQSQTDRPQRNGKVFFGCVTIAGGVWICSGSLSLACVVD
jgi:hypothetical protein